MEEWRIISEFPRYSVSNLGRVRNNKTHRIMKLSNDFYGYLQVHLRNSKCNRVVKVHRLVATEFCSNIYSYGDIDHIDGDKKNNCAINLRWVTPSENRNNPITSARFIANRNRIEKLHKAVIQYNIDGTLVKEWESIIAIERKLGYGHQNISSCCKGKLKTAYNYIWRFKL